MPITLPFAEYQFTYKALAPINMPELNGTLWHSVLGNALHKISCITKQTSCKACQKSRACDYSQLFCGIPPDKLCQSKNIPVSHIFHSDTVSYQIKPQQHFSSQLILIGEANHKLPLFIEAMRLVGNNGFNKERHKAQLKQVVQTTPYGIKRSILLENKQQQEGIPMLYPIVKALKKVRIQFKTPFRHTGKAVNSPTFLLDHFLMTLIRRISQLQYYYCNNEPDDNFKELKQLTKTLAILNQKMHKKKLNFLSYRRNQHQQDTAWVGFVDIAMQQHEALWVYLYLGQWLNVGKNTSMGFGQYQLIDLA